jgi:5-methylcytosine-specific restriction endonuclease McrA
MTEKKETSWLPTKPRSADPACWNCQLPLGDSTDQLVIEISRPHVGRQQRTVPLCNKCGEIFGKES